MVPGYKIPSAAYEEMVHAIDAHLVFEGHEKDDQKAESILADALRLANIVLKNNSPIVLVVSVIRCGASFISNA